MKRNMWVFFVFFIDVGQARREEMTSFHLSSKLLIG
jgi:hypothetical protein